MTFLQGNHSAWLTYDGKTFVTQTKRSPLNSSVTQLIESIYERYPQTARKILRKRISTNEPYSDFAYGMIKIAAKSCDWQQDLPLFDEDVIHLTQTSNTQKPYLDHQWKTPPPRSKNLLEWGQWLKIENESDSDHQKPRYLQNRKVTAVLLSEDFEILGFTKNQNAIQKTHHAEYLLIKNWTHKNQTPLPKNSQLFVSLQPCKMCSSALFEAAEDMRTLKIYYLQPDPGSATQNTVFQKYREFAGCSVSLKLS